MIPGAVKKADSALLPASNCGGGAGLVGEDAAAAAKTSTLCCKKCIRTYNTLLVF